ncbi:MAG: type II toxin-antitoxin system VapC family toxin [Beijerinckiaceae bacterium]
MAELAGSHTVYFDTNIWIYYIEGGPELVGRIADLIGEAAANGARLATNELAVAECLYQPSRDRNDRALAAYERLFGCGEIDILPLDGGLARRAAAIGGELRLKLLDAIHYLSALEAGCDLFVTSDVRFRTGPNMDVLRLKVR